MSKVATAVAEPLGEDRDMPAVKPAMVQVNVEGFTSRFITVHMPAGAVADDLRDPGIWKLVQGNAPSALRKYDNLTIFGADESWMASAIVSVAKADSAQLVILKVGSFRAADEGLFSDGTYKVTFVGVGYQIERVNDGSKIGHAHASEALAVAAIRRMYPQRVA